MKTITKLFAFLLIITFYTSCSRSLTHHDEFTNVTTKRSEWIDFEKGNPFKYFQIAPLCEISKDGTKKYALMVAIGNPITTYQTGYPCIIEHESLHLLIDGAPYVYSTKQAHICRQLCAGLFAGWEVETAIYKYLNKEELLKITKAKEVKIKVGCQVGGARMATFSPNAIKELTQFLENN